jgi:hypothetical protein
MAKFAIKTIDKDRGQRNDGMEKNFSQHPFDK